MPRHFQTRGCSFDLGCPITIDNVPAWTCEQCGEPLFEEQEVEAVQDIVKAVDEKCRRLQCSA